MRKNLLMIIAALSLATVAFATESQIWGEMRIQNILEYGKEGSTHLGPLFTLLQNKLLCMDIPRSLNRSSFSLLISIT
nr:hypothetical protein [Sulfurospirillum diekertiae]